MASKATNLTLGDRVTALDSAGNLYHGHIDPGFAGAVDDCLGIDGIERQKLYVRHMHRTS